MSTPARWCERGKKRRGGEIVRLCKLFRRAFPFGKGARIWIRIPVIGGVNDEAEELERMAGFLSENVHAEQINLIPYHNTGSGKYVHLGREYKGGMFYAPPKERMQELQRLMESKNIAPVFIGG